MSRYRKDNIDRKSNKPDPIKTETTRPDQLLNRAAEIRRDDDVIRVPVRTLYDIDYAMKSFIDNEIQPQVVHHDELIRVDCIFANGEKWDNVRRLGYLRDEKGMLQSPLIVIKRNSVSERDQLDKLDVNRRNLGQSRIYRQKYNKNNRYTDQFLPSAMRQEMQSAELYLVNIPRYVSVSYELLLWTDFTAQMNSLVEQFLQYKGMHWGNEFNSYQTMIQDFQFETINTVGEDRLVRATTTLEVKGSLLAEHEFRKSTLQKAYSIKQVRFDSVIDVDTDIFSTTAVPTQLLQAQSQVYTGGSVTVSSGGSSTVINTDTMTYLVNLTEQQATYSNSSTVTVAAAAAINPTTSLAATKAEFDVYINGQYIDKAAYTWTPASTETQTIVFDTDTLEYTIESDDVIIVNGRWAE